MNYPLPQDRSYSWEEYLQFERDTEDRYEYHDGNIVAMAGASNRHNKIVGNVYFGLKSSVSQKGCDLFSETVKLFRHRSDRYLYPDLMVTCAPLDQQTQNGVRSPQLVVEVLSPHSAYGDQTFKLREYFRLPSLRHYLIVAQDLCLVQHYHMIDGGEWRFSLYQEMDQAISLPEWDIQLSLESIYDGIEMAPNPDEVAEGVAEFVAPTAGAPDDQQ